MQVIGNRATIILLVWSIIIQIFPLKASDTISGDTTTHRKVRNAALITAGIYGLSLFGLNKAWYSEFPRSSFHFFNDNQQWMQLDKAGHFYSSYHLSKVSAEFLLRSGMPANKAYLWGGLTGVLMLTPIEILDGFSEQYGASWGDLAANTGGALFAVAQYLWWQEQRIKPKYSFASTALASRRPEVLGDGFHEEFIKDYNGQTYWLSIDLWAFSKHSNFPKWLNIAVGYGADNLIYANESQNKLNGLDPYRQYYVGLDFDLSYMHSRSGLINTLIDLIDLIHLPAPTLEYNRSIGLKFHWLKI